jgi:hypothetical protein
VFALVQGDKVLDDLEGVLDCLAGWLLRVDVDQQLAVGAVGLFELVGGDLEVDAVGAV